jgi:hypothetical protein
MFASYVTPEEVITRYDVQRWGGDDWQTVLRAKLAAARMDVGEDLRARGFNLALLSLPLMFDTLSNYDTTTSAGRTSASIEGENANRVVFDCRTAAMNASVTLQGSHDDTHWETIPMINGQPLVMNASEAKIYTQVFPGRYSNYRYILEADGSIQYSVFLTDTSTDLLVIYRAIILLLLPYSADNNSVTAIYTDMRSAYDNAISTLRASYDADNSGTIDEEEQRSRGRVRVMR